MTGFLTSPTDTAYLAGETEWTTIVQAATDSRAASRHVDTWVFDLDNTLYPHDANLWPQVDKRITT